MTGKASNSELRNFGLVLGAAFVLFFGVLPLVRAHRPAIWPLGLAAALWTVALLAPWSLQRLYALWTRLGHVLGWLNSRIILTILFFVWVVPAGLVTRLRKRNRLGAGFDPKLESYRAAGRKRSPKSMELPY